MPKTGGLRGGGRVRRKQRGSGWLGDAWDHVKDQFTNVPAPVQWVKDNFYHVGSASDRPSEEEYIRGVKQKAEKEIRGMKGYTNITHEDMKARVDDVTANDVDDVKRNYAKRNRDKWGMIEGAGVMTLGLVGRSPAIGAMGASQLAGAYATSLDSVDDEKIGKHHTLANLGSWYASYMAGREPGHAATSEAEQAANEQGSAAHEDIHGGIDAGGDARAAGPGVRAQEANPRAKRRRRLPRE